MPGKDGRRAPVRPPILGQNARLLFGRALFQTQQLGQPGLHGKIARWPDVRAAFCEQQVTLIDRELFRFAEIWAAAGHPNGVFRLAPAELEALTGAPVADVTKQA